VRDAGGPGQAPHDVAGAARQVAQAEVVGGDGEVAGGGLVPQRLDLLPHLGGHGGGDGLGDGLGDVGVVVLEGHGRQPAAVDPQRDPHLGFAPRDLRWRDDPRLAGPGPGSGAGARSRLGAVAGIHGGHIIVNVGAHR
jgi:hypothetical protein